MSSLRMSELANTIRLNTIAVEEHIRDHKLPYPSLDVNGPAQLDISDEKITAARLAVLGAIHELRTVMLGPIATLMAVESEDLLTLQAIYRYNIASSFGIDEEASFETISAACGLNLVDLRRILRYAMTNYIFCEPRTGIVAHTAISRLLAQDKHLRDYVGMICEERFPASARTVDALEKYGSACDPAQSGFSLSQNTSRGLYDELHHYPERERRWTSSMGAIALRIDFNFIMDAFDWKSYSGATVVDVGGGSGTVSAGLASRLPSLKFVVQDSEAVIGQSDVPAAVKDRVSFMPHDFFQEQPVRGAEIYYFRNIFHNWPDAKCISILRNHIPALAADTRIIIDDWTLHEPRTLLAYEERQQRLSDIRMLTFFGSRERTIDEWGGLLRDADPRFVLKGSKRSVGQASTILEVGWQG